MTTRTSLRSVLRSSQSQSLYAGGGWSLKFFQVLEATQRVRAYMEVELGFLASPGPLFREKSILDDSYLAFLGSSLFQVPEPHICSYSQIFLHIFTRFNVFPTYSFIFPTYFFIFPTYFSHMSTYSHLKVVSWENIRNFPKSRFLEGGGVRWL